MVFEAVSEPVLLVWVVLVGLRVVLVVFDGAVCVVFVFIVFGSDGGNSEDMANLTGSLALSFSKNKV